MSDVAQHQWFRVVIDHKGKVVSCTPAGPAHDHGLNVFFVFAVDDEQAGKKVFNRYMAQRMRERRARLVSEGKCRWCGRPNDREPGKRCSQCSERDITYSKRWRANERGDEFPPADRHAAVAARNEEKRATILAEAAPFDVRLAILLEVQRAWTASANNGIFSAWLAGQIEQIKGRRVA